jgi:hypothetical protein
MECIPTLGSTHECHLRVDWDAFEDDIAAYTEEATFACKCPAVLSFWSSQYTFTNLTLDNKTYFGPVVFHTENQLARMLPSSCDTGDKDALSVAFCKAVAKSTGWEVVNCTGTWSLGAA